MSNQWRTGHQAETGLISCLAFISDNFSRLVRPLPDSKLFVCFLCLVTQKRDKGSDLLHLTFIRLIESFCINCTGAVIKTLFIITSMELKCLVS